MSNLIGQGGNDVGCNKSVVVTMCIEIEDLRIVT